MRPRFRPRRWSAVAVTFAACLIGSGCTGEYNPQSQQAHDIDGLWWVMLWLAVAVFVVVIGFAAYALFHKRRAQPSTMEKSRTQFIFLFLGGAFVPLLILAAVFGYSLDVTRDAGADQPNQLLIHVTGHQWWYQVDYPNQKISSRNVMHIPEHRQVKIILTSADVIHSFWVPELNGKTDIIPGVTNQLFITGPQPGTYIGHCAEFCGIGHTTMKITVVVEPESTFNKWVASQKGA